MDFTHYQPPAWRLDDAEKMVLFQRLLPALFECHAQLSVVRSKLSPGEARLFAALAEGDRDLHAGCSMFDEMQKRLAWVRRSARESSIAL